MSEENRDTDESGAIPAQQRRLGADTEKGRASHWSRPTVKRKYIADTDGKLHVTPAETWSATTHIPLGPGS